MTATSPMIAAAPPASRTRNTAFDIAKGLAILTIVLCHETRGLQNAHLMPRGTTWDWFDELFYLYHVPVFFFITGLFADRSFEQGGFVGFLKSKFAAIALPYAVWQTCQICMMVLAGGATNHQVTRWDLLWFPIVPYMQFWFLYVLMLVLIVYALLKRAGAPTSMILAISVAMLFLPRFDTWPPFHPLCKHMVYFSLGLLLRDHLGIVQRIGTRWLLLGAVFAFACIYITLPLDGSKPFRVLPASVGVAATLALATALSRTRIAGALSWFGARSLDIFLAHSICAAGMRIVLTRIVHTDDLTAHLALGFIASVAGPLLFFEAARHEQTMWRKGWRRTLPSASGAMTSATSG